MAPLTVSNRNDCATILSSYIRIELLLSFDTNKRKDVWCNLVVKIHEPILGECSVPSFHYLQCDANRLITHVFLLVTYPAMIHATYTTKLAEIFFRGVSVTVWKYITHWGLVIHTYLSIKYTIIGSDNSLSPVGPHAIIWTNAALLSIRPQEIYFN